MLLLNQVADDLVIEELNWFPLDAFALVLLLLTFESELNEHLLQLLVTVVDAELLEAES